MIIPKFLACPCRLSSGSSSTTLDSLPGVDQSHKSHLSKNASLFKTNTKKVDVFLVIAAICTAINGALRINIFISLGFYGIWYSLTARRLWIPAAVLWILQYVGFALFVVFRGFPSPVALALGIAQTPSLINLFVLGLVAGSLSFGGAYTAIPFIQVEAALKGGWLPQSVFIDCIAIGNILPAPLVIFAPFVGFHFCCNSQILFSAGPQ